MKNILRNNSMFGVDTCQNKIVSNIIIEENESTYVCRPESLIKPRTGMAMEDLSLPSKLDKLPSD